MLDSLLMGIETPSPLYQGNALSLTITQYFLSLTIAQYSLVNFQTARRMTLRPSVLAGQLDKKNQLYTTCIDEVIAFRGSP